MPQLTDHFSSSQWVDLVRGQLAEDIATGMDRHLRADCAECSAAFAVWQGLAVFAQEERTLTPPDNALRVVKSYLAHQRPARPVSSFEGRLEAWTSVTLAALTFDSLQTAPVGVRAAAGVARHVVFEAKSLVVDLHIDVGSRAGWYLLSGQVADSRHPERPLGSLRLSLVDACQDSSMLQTNEFGEFHIAFDRRKHLKLVVYATHNVVVIPLDSLFDASRATTEASD